MIESNGRVQADGLNIVMSQCLDLKSPKSFFLFAGAGSGKTRALVEAMNMFRQKHGQDFRFSGQKVAVITYTNAACDEIKQRIEFDSIFAVSTIHSFAWELILTYSKDIREWLSHNLEEEIKNLEEKQRKGRGGKAANDRDVRLKSKRNRRDRLNTINNFTYNPNGENIGKNSLDHAEVIGLAADFICNKPLMQNILVRKYPVLLIDESQDTQKDLIDAFFKVQQKHSAKFCLGLFGDTMQRIYADGKRDLAGAIPGEWEKPEITVNYRCPKRIVRLINAIRFPVDGHVQEAAHYSTEGFVRLFLVSADEHADKTAIEANITEQMAAITSDDKWTGQHSDVKMLALEHHMAASRGGFSYFFEPLYRVQKFKTGLLLGTLSGIPFLSQQILPLIESLRPKDRFAVARIAKKYSPILCRDTLKDSNSQLKELRKADEIVKSLFALWDGNSDPLLIDVLKKVAESGLFAIPEVFMPIISRGDSFVDDPISDNSGKTSDDDQIEAWENALSAPFSQLQSYVEYISDLSPFGTHQGIKGLQFPRVMVILDDKEARGFMFSYEILLGAKDPSPTDLKNSQEGNESSIDRTRRLFYVTCSRAQNSLAIVVYTNNKNKIKEKLIKLKWFDDDEIIDEP